MAETTDKDEIVRRVEEYLKDNNALDLKIFLLDKNWDWSRITPELISDIANRMRKGNKYNFKPEGIGDMFTYIISRKTNPLWHDLKVGIITGLISLLVGWLLFLLSSQDTSQQNRQQDEHLIRLDSAINNLRNGRIIRQFEISVPPDTTVWPNQ
jgi:hypothetical protein